jgi:hypothetical protein
MIMIPRERPVLENLNSHYIDLLRLAEHCQGEFGSGCIHLKSSKTEGVIFFDNDAILNSFFQSKDEQLEGQNALDRIFEVMNEQNFTIHVYEIGQRKTYFWANIPTAREIYKDLRTEFADLEGLIREMNAEELTGFIDVSISDGKETGLIFFDSGQIVGGSYSWEKGELNNSKDSQELLIRKVKQSGGIFRVSKIAFPKGEDGRESEENAIRPSRSTITMVEELMGIFERVVKSNRKIKQDFSTLVKKKFVEKVEKYPFLDPFTAEFSYSDRRITFVGNTSDEKFAKGVMESVKELASELRILLQLRGELVFWLQKHQGELGRWGISF